jgi:hypothetical protein
VDLRVLPLLIFVYALALIDRYVCFDVGDRRLISFLFVNSTNLGLARVAGMGADLVRLAKIFVPRPLKLTSNALVETRTGEPLHHRFGHLLPYVYLTVSFCAKTNLKIDADIFL